MSDNSIYDSTWPCAKGIYDKAETAYFRDKQFRDMDKDELIFAAGYLMNEIDSLKTKLDDEVKLRKEVDETM